MFFPAVHENKLNSEPACSSARTKVFVLLNPTVSCEAECEAATLRDGHYFYIRVTDDGESPRREYF